MIMTQRTGDTDTIWVDPMPRSSRMIAGIASTDRVNSNGVQFESLGMKSPQLPAPLLIGHNDDDEVGEVFWLSRSSEEVRIRGRIFRNRAGDETWRRIEAGELRFLSVGAEYNRGEAVRSHDGAKRIGEWSLREVSLVTNPANPDCTLKTYRPPIFLGSR